MSYARGLSPLLFLPSWLTMQVILKPKFFKSSVPPKSQRKRFREIANYISSDPDNEAIVTYSNYIKYNEVYYYDREQSIKCTGYLRNRGRGECDSTFSMEEFRRVSD